MARRQRSRVKNCTPKHSHRIGIGMLRQVKPNCFRGFGFIKLLTLQNLFRADCFYDTPTAFI